MFESHQKGAFKLTFSNGVAVSVIWKPGSYSDNHNVFNGTQDINHDWLMGLDSQKPTVSSTAEVMVTDDPTGRATKYMERHFGYNPAGYLSVDNVMEILNYVKDLKWKYYF